MTEPFVVTITPPRTYQEKIEAERQHQNLLKMLGLNLTDTASNPASKPAPKPAPKPTTPNEFIDNVISNWKEPSL